jgi:predicted polyphosphate/ATP-dependent NAD kinase
VEKKKLGLIVNPVAGMGGRVGLKGSDGAEILARARALGAVPESPNRALEALRRLAPLQDRFEVLTVAHEMGADEARSLGYDVRVLTDVPSGSTTPEDTRRGARMMVDEGADLIIFAGGDGTARDIFAAIGDRATVLGIPAGVKIHSGVYALTPRTAGDLASLFIEGRILETKMAEVMDIDEDAFREGRVSAALHGYLRIPLDSSRVQSMKAARGESEAFALEQIAYGVTDRMQDGRLYIVGPGTTTKAIKDKLGIEGTLLGVDLVRDRQLVARDAGERQIIDALDGHEGPATIVVTVIGGQGYIFGRGNQQLSPRVIRRVGRPNVQVVATKDKATSLIGKPLLVDTGDEDLNGELEGYLRVLVGYDDQMMMKVGAPE